MLFLFLQSCGCFVLFLGVDSLRTSGLGTEEGVRALEGEVRSQILCTFLIVSCKLFRSTLLEDGSLIKKVCSVDDREGLAYVMVCDDDSDILVLELGDDVLDILDGDRVDFAVALLQAK